MRCATQASPDQTDLGRARGVKRDQSTESGITVYDLDSLIRTPSRVCMVRSGQHLQSGHSDQSPAQSLDSVINYLMNIKDHAKDKVLIIVVELKTFLYQTNIFTEELKRHIQMTNDHIFLKKYIIPMTTATSTVKSVSQGTANARSNCVWLAPQCETEVGLEPHCATQVGLAPEVHD